MSLPTPAAGSAPPRKKKKVDRTARYLLPALGLGGAGAGFAAHSIADDALAERAGKTFADYNPQAFSDPSQLPPNHTDLTYYQRTLSPAAQMRLGGMPVGQALAQLRTSKPLMKALGTEAYHLPPGPRMHGVSGVPHYRAFHNGPIPAYIHQMKAKYRSNQVPEELGGGRYTDWMGKKFEDFVIGRSKDSINPYEVTRKFMPHEDQLKLMEDFHASLSPEEQAYRMQVEDLDTAKYQSQTNNYLPKAQALLKAHNRAKTIGTTLSGAATGGLAGNLLHRLIAGNDSEDRQSWGRRAATGGGALAGGGLGYWLFNTGSGKQVMNNILEKVRGMYQKDAAACKWAEKQAGFGRLIGQGLRKALPKMVRGAKGAPTPTPPKTAPLPPLPKGPHKVSPNPVAPPTVKPSLDNLRRFQAGELGPKPLFKAKYTPPTPPKTAPQAATGSQTPNRAVTTVKNFVAPKTKPTMAPQATVAPTPPAATMARRTGQRAQQARDYVANVPKGETFGQRPVANTRRLLTLDGVPGMRRVNQAAIGAAAAGGGYGVHSANKYINDNINTAANAVGTAAGASPEQVSQIEGDFNAAKWDMGKDQTFGRVKRLLPGSSAKHQDQLINNIIGESVKSYIHNPTNAASTSPLKNRTPVAAAINQVPTLAKQVVPPPSVKELGKDIATGMARTAINRKEPTAIEAILRHRLGAAWDRLTPAQKSRFIATLSAPTAEAARAASR